MNEELLEFLGRINTGVLTTFHKTRHDKYNLEILETISSDSEGVMATTGWCVVDSFPDASFTMQPFELKKCVQLGKEISSDGNLLIVKDETNSFELTKSIQQDEPQSIKVEYKDAPIFIPTRVMKKLRELGKEKFKSFGLTIRGGEMKIVGFFEDTTAGYFVTSCSVNHPDIELKFSGTINKIFSNIWHGVLAYLGDEETPMMLLTRGNGWEIKHYLVPIGE